jgi:CheY-like chemotaxis protein
LLILDHDTPLDGGIEFIEKIKKDPLIPIKPKFILMIALLREDLFEKIETFNIDFGIIKPIMPSVLYNGITEIFKENIMEKHENQSQLNEKDKLVVDYPYNLLVVEDNKTNQFIAKSILEQAGFRVYLAGNGQEGYDFFISHRQEVDLILMDLHMPVLNGYDAAAMIRKTDESIPIVAMTADAIIGVEERCKSAGINHYVSKPFDPEQFIATIIKILEPLKAKHNEIVTVNAEPEISNNEEKIINEADALNRMGNNIELYQMVLKEYYNENIDTISKLENALKDKNYKEAVQIVHKIKGSSGNIGAKKLYDIASEFQKCLSCEDEAEIDRLNEQFISILEKLLKEILEKVPDLCK